MWYSKGKWKRGEECAATDQSCGSQWVRREEREGGGIKGNGCLWCEGHSRTEAESAWCATALNQPPKRERSREGEEAQERSGPASLPLASSLAPLPI